MDLLVRRAKRRDKEAFTLLMEQYGKNMYKVAKAILKNDEDVADAMQETVLTCWEKVGTLKKEEYFKTWLIRILINKCNAIYRERKNLVWEENVPDTAKYEEAYEKVEWHQFLNGLEEKFRIVIVLYYAEGFKVREIAEMLQVSESTVKVRLVEARKQAEALYQIRRRGKNDERL